MPRLNGLTPLCLLLAACSGGSGDTGSDDGGDGPGVLPSSVDLAGVEIKTRNWGLLMEHSLYDQDQDGEADYAEGTLELIGTDYDDPCGFVERNGGPPEGEAGEWVRITAQLGDLPLDGWAEGEAYEADGSQRFVRFEGYRVGDNDDTLFEAGGPAEGSVTDEGNDEFGQHVRVEATLGYVREGVANTQVDPPERLVFNVGGDDVADCPPPADEG